jgi:FkbM family methyltransferase
MKQSVAPTRRDVISAYHFMLGREPESEDVINHQLQHAATVVELIRNFADSNEFLTRIPPTAGSRFFHFNASIEVMQIIKSHINPSRVPVPEHYVNFLGVAVPTKVFPFLEDKGGQLDPVPIPANFHADMAEWAASLRAVDLAKGRFVMLELGCGWGCWMNNTGVAAKARGLSRQLIGIEADDKHLNFARETLAANGISEDEFVLLQGIAASRPGYALFPASQSEDNWGKEPLFDVSESEREARIASGEYEQLKMVSLRDAMGDNSTVDLVHMDIQGGEAMLVEECIDLLTERVHYLVIGTHSRSIEGQLFDVLLRARWELEVERPAIFRIVEGKPITDVDGVQGWRNPRFDHD